MQQEPSKNPLFAEWLYEWWKAEQAKGNERLAFVYKRAHDAMTRFPDVLATGQEATVVPFIGKGIAAKLQARLDSQAAVGENGSTTQSLNVSIQKGVVMVDLSGSTTASSQSKVFDASSASIRSVDDSSNGHLVDSSIIKAKKSKSRENKTYIPSYRSGAFAILMALYKGTRDNDGQTMTKTEIIQIGQGLCDASFTVPDRGRSRGQSGSNAQYGFTAWSAMKNLLQKDLVNRRGHPAHRYTLTEEGRAIALKLEQGITHSVTESSLDSDTTNATRPSTPSHQTMNESTAQTLQDLPFVRFPGKSFDVTLLLDSREVLDRGDRTLFAAGLEKEGIRVETRSLDLGDALWIARDSSGTEIVLDYLVERKTMADLVASIKDGRFKEQSFRQRRCGLRHIVYLVEDTHMQTAKTFGWDTIQTVLVEIQTRDGFFLKRVASGQESIDYLANMTRSLERIYKDRDLLAFTCMDKNLMNDFQETEKLLTYDAFRRLNTKTKSNTIQDIWGKQLLTVKGMSLEKASLVSRHFPTCSLFVDHFSEMEPAAREAEIVGLGNPLSRRGIKGSLARKLCQVFFDESVIL